MFESSVRCRDRLMLQSSRQAVARHFTSFFDCLYQYSRNISRPSASIIYLIIALCHLGLFHAAFSSRMACEENLPGQTRDWNEELQVTHELPQNRLTERLLRDRAIFKSNSDFVVAAVRAAVSVVNGDIMAINPGENKKQQMFIWNNMFFSLGFDVKEHYKHFGGEYAAYVATVSFWLISCSTVSYFAYIFSFYSIP